MAANADGRTSITLLERVSRGPADSLAWDEFARCYRPKILQWCRGWGVQEADAEDVAQLVLAKMLKLLRDFRYNPAGSFRAWLKTVARHVWSDLRVSHARVVSADSLILSIAAQADLEARLEAAYDHELLELAIGQVRSKVAPTTWEVFQLTAIEGLPSATVAQRLAMAVGNVYASKYRVQKLLQQAVAELERASGAAG